MIQGHGYLLDLKAILKTSSAKFQYVFFQQYEISSALLPFLLSGQIDHLQPIAEAFALSINQS